MMNKAWSLAAFALILIAGCTSQTAPTSQAIVPTLAQFPSATIDPAIPTQTSPPIPTLTPSPLPSPTLSWTPTPAPPCESAEWWGEAESLVVEFLDIADVAGATPRLSLSGVLIELRRTFREFEGADYPGCVHELRDELVFGMNWVADGYNDFSADLEMSSSADLRIAQAHFWAAVQLLRVHSLAVDSRLLSVFDGYAMNQQTVTWISEAGFVGMMDYENTRMWSELNARGTQVFSDFNTLQAKYP